MIVVERPDGTRRLVRPGERHDGERATGEIRWSPEELLPGHIVFKKCSACGKDGVYEYG